MERTGLPPGGSTWTTSAPKSASVWLAWAPAGLLEKSSTRRPASGPAWEPAVAVSGSMAPRFITRGLNEYTKY